MKVRDVIKELEMHGWRHKATVGSHRQFVHATQPGRVTVPGHPGDDIHPKTLASIRNQARLEGTYGNG